METDDKETAPGETALIDAPPSEPDEEAALDEAAAIDDVPSKPDKAAVHDSHAAAVTEKREYPRHLISWRAGLLCQSSGTTIPVPGKIKEASPTGVTFLSDRQLLKGQKVTLVMQLPFQAGSPVIEVRAKALVTNSILSRTGFRSGLALQEFLSGREDFLKCFPKNK